ncbi:sulfotransferase [Streptomyces sp. B93]|uniref:sulfotransferase n=1 Tax=Streptomyces sp. B93 TaxID=2824875 RepID=UPI001B392BED|nr:sulfotransferase [Streptomyces sp. B93]MBQ1088037.1 sulfotransferase [Streptomyces sp. B93]
MPNPIEAPPGQVFVTGTGRCGSTLVSELLRDHPQVLSLSELFNHLTDMYRISARVFPEGTVTAREFWGILSSRNAVNRLLTAHGIAPKEILYRPTAPGARFSAEDGIPALLLTTLPHLTDTPDALYDEIEAAVASFPDAPVADHYALLFSWLCARFGKTLWAERSGGSLILAGQFREHFPDARYLHIVRDGRDCALSMSRHTGFRMAAVVMALHLTLGRDPYAEQPSGEPAKESELGFVPEELLPFLPDRFDAAAVRDYRVPVSLFGTYWADEMQRGTQALSLLPPENVLHVWYEDLLAAPEETLHRIGEFLGADFVDAEWEKRAAARVGQPSSSWRDLPDPEREELERACAPGFGTLAAHGVVPMAGTAARSGT